jgi:two-component system, OmpR family, heavy metal sensor histidine kinase CusS
MSRKPLSLTARLSLTFAASAVCVLLVAGLLFERAADNQFLQHDREELSGKVELLSEELARVEDSATLARLPARLREAVLGHPGIAISVRAADGRVLFQTGPQDVLAHLLQGLEVGQADPVVWRSAEHAYRVAGARLPLRAPGIAFADVGVALDISDDQEFRAAFQEFLWFGMFLSALAMAWLGWVAVRSGLSPLRELSTTMGNVSAEQLNQPMDAANVPRELRELVWTYNLMLARLEESFRRLTEFSSDIAHDLRTPINNLMIQTEVTLRQDIAPCEYRTILQSNLEEFARMSRMIGDMLFLAKADNHLVFPTREPIDLRAEVERLREFYEALASDAGVRLTQTGTATLMADRVMLQRALSNLLSNAIRFTPAGMAVEVAMREDDDGAQIDVTNPGPEIPPEHLPHVFERLYRADPSRRDSSDHVGLGLAITRSVVAMHGGTIAVQSAKGRTCFSIGLPRVAMAS